VNPRLNIFCILLSLFAGSVNATEFSSFTGGHAVELSSFEVSDMENKVALSWATTSEKNANHMFVERSNDGKNWSSVTKIKAAENSDHPLYYEFFDESPLTGTSYYRLRIEGLGGDLEFSETKILEHNGKQNFVILYPSQTAGLFNLASSYNINDVDFEVSDASDKRIVVSAEVVSDEKMVLDLSELPKGTYFVSMKTPDKLVVGTQKITLK
jgi:hypothetical protein